MTSNTGLVSDRAREIVTSQTVDLPLLEDSKNNPWDAALEAKAVRGVVCRYIGDQVFDPDNISLIEECAEGYCDEIGPLNGVYEALIQRIHEASISQVHRLEQGEAPFERELYSGLQHASRIIEEPDNTEAPSAEKLADKFAITSANGLSIPIGLTEALAQLWKRRMKFQIPPDQIEKATTFSTAWHTVSHWKNTSGTLSQPLISSLFTYEAFYSREDKPWSRRRAPNIDNMQIEQLQSGAYCVTPKIDQVDLATQYLREGLSRDPRLADHDGKIPHRGCSGDALDLTISLQQFGIPSTVRVSTTVASLVAGYDLLRKFWLPEFQ